MDELRLSKGYSNSGYFYRVIRVSFHPCVNEFYLRDCFLWKHEKIDFLLYVLEITKVRRSNHSMDYTDLETIYKIEFLITMIAKRIHHYLTLELPNG